MMTGIEGIAFALLVDIFFVVLVAGMVSRYGRLRHSHPMTIYLLFHVMTFTFRLASLLMGAETLFADLPASRYDVVTYDEISRAAILADFALLAMALGCLLASSADFWQWKRKEESCEQNYKKIMVLTDWNIVRVVAITIPIGVVALIMSSRGQGPSLTDSSYLHMMPTWAGLSVMALIYFYGFRRVLVIAMFAYVGFMALQGHSRYRAIIPCVFMTQLYLDKTGRRWPSIRVVAMLVVLALLFYPLKTIGNSVKAGVPVTEIVQDSIDSIGEAFKGGHGDTQFMDQFAMGLTLIDQSGELEYGYAYVPALTLWIPRQLWAEKPGLAYWMHRIAIPTRPVAEMGMIVTILGESYVNFGLVGIYAVMFLVGYLLSRFHFVAYRLPGQSVVRFTYLMVSCNLIQGYRDGVTSILMFPTAHMIPLTLIVILHFVDPHTRILVRESATVNS